MSDPNAQISRPTQASQKQTRGHDGQDSELVNPNGVRRPVGLPDRPTLRPGVFVCRRGDDQLQVGATAATAVTAPDTESVRGLLADLRAGYCVDGWDHDSARLCEDLLQRGLIVPADEIARDIARAETRPQREAVVAAYATSGPRASKRLSERAASRVLVTHDHLPRAAERVRTALGVLGVVAVSRRGPETGGPETGGPETSGAAGGADLSDPPTDPVDLEVHLARGEVQRVRSDRWQHDDRTHLVLATREGVPRVGPFVIPGRTACLRCLDAHVAEQDPRWPLVMEQYAATSPQEVDSRWPGDQVYPELLDLALAWIVRDAVAWCEGETPRTLSASVEVDPQLCLEVTTWPPHPHCGCHWGLSARAQSA